MMRSIGAMLLCTGLALGCGGGSGGGGTTGIPENTLIADVTPDQAADLCEFFIGLQESPERTIDCNGEPTTVGINPEDIDEAVAECTAGIQSDVMPGCPVTVGEAEDCFNALADLTDTDAEICEGTEMLPAACDELFSNDLCG